MKIEINTVNVTIERRFSLLPKQSRERIREYVAQNRNAKSEVLAEELFLPVSTIRSLKSSITRSEENMSWDYHGCFRLPNGDLF